MIEKKELKNVETAIYQECEKCGQMHFIHEACPPPPLGIKVSERAGSQEKVG